MGRVRLMVGLLLQLMLASCGVPITSGASFVQGADVVGPLTFSWNQEQDLTVGDQRLRNNRFFEARLHEAIEWELSLRGLRLDDTSPDLLIHHHLTLTDHEMIEEIIDEQGYSREEVYSYEQGTIVVHMVDARTGEDFWVGWAQANVEPALAGPVGMRDWVYDVVERLFRDWPLAERS